MGLALRICLISFCLFVSYFFKKPNLVEPVILVGITVEKIFFSYKKLSESMEMQKSKIKLKQLIPEVTIAGILPAFCLWTLQTWRRDHFLALILISTVFYSSGYWILFRFDRHVSSFFLYRFLFPPVSLNILLSYIFVSVCICSHVSFLSVFILTLTSPELQDITN